MISHAAHPVVPPPTDSLLPSGSWTVDTARSTVGFAVRHLRLATVRGRFTDFAGRLDLDASPAITGSIGVGSIDTGDIVRDDNLCAPGFFAVDRHPRMWFTADEAVRDGIGWRLTGEMTIRGVTRPLVLRAVTVPQDYDTVRIMAGGHLSRRAFGLEWDRFMDAGRLLVADRIELELDVIAMRG